MATHSSVLAWRIPGTGEPGGLPSMGSHRVGYDWSDLAGAAVPLSCTMCWKENLSCIESLWTCVRMSWPLVWRFWILSCWPVSNPPWVPHILRHCSLIVCLELGECSVLPFQGVLPVLGPLCFHWNLGISLSASLKKLLGFDRDCAQSLDQLETCWLFNHLECSSPCTWNVSPLTQVLKNSFRWCHDVVGGVKVWLDACGGNPGG